MSSKPDDTAEDRGARTAGSLVWQAINYALIALMSLIFLIVAARIIPVADFGAYAIVSVVVALVSQFAEIGIGAALVQRKSFNRFHVSIAFWGAIAASTLLYLAVYAAASPIGHAYGEASLVDMIRVAGIALLFASVGVVPQSLLIRDLRFRTLFVANCGAYLLSHLLLGLYLAQAGYGAWALVVAFVASKVLLSALLWLLCPVRIGWAFRTAEFKDIAHFGSGLTIIRILNSFAENVDKLVLGLLTSLSVVGLYERVMYSVRIPLIYVGHVFDAPLFSVMARSGGDGADQTEFFASSLAVCLGLGLYISSYTLLFPDAIVLALLGGAWRDAIPVMPILGMLISVNLVARMCDVVVRSRNRMFRSVLPKSAYVALVAAGAVGGWVAGGLKGVAFGVVIACVGHLVLMLRVATSILGTRIRFVAAAVLHTVGFVMLFVAKNALLSLVNLDAGENARFAWMAAAIASDAALAVAIYAWRPALMGARLEGAVAHMMSYLGLRRGAANLMRK